MFIGDEHARLSGWLVGQLGEVFGHAKTFSSECRGPFESACSIHAWLIDGVAEGVKDIKSR